MGDSQGASPASYYFIRRLGYINTGAAQILFAIGESTSTATGPLILLRISLNGAATPTITHSLILSYPGEYVYVRGMIATDAWTMYLYYYHPVSGVFRYAMLETAGGNSKIWWITLTPFGFVGNIMNQAVFKNANNAYYVAAIKRINDPVRPQVYS